MSLEVLLLTALIAWIAVSAINRLRRRLSALTPDKSKGDEEILWDRLVENGGCLKCNAQPKGFAEGPQGGMNTNVFCIRCGQGYNIAPMLSWAQEIGKNERYVEKEVTHGER